MTFDNARNRVRVQKSTPEALGKPMYIRALFNKQNRTFILKSVANHEIIENGYHFYNLIYIPNDVCMKDRPYEYQNQNIMPLMRSSAKWHSFAEYRVKGTIHRGMTFMDLDDYDIIVAGSPLRIVT